MTATTLLAQPARTAPAPRGPDPGTEVWTERDHADQYIVDMMVPLLELADAFPKMIELVGEHLLSRFGNAESEELRVADADVIRTWDNLVRFTTGMQEMLTADRPRAMAGVTIRVRPAPPAERVVVHAASNGHAAAEIPGWEER